MLLIDARNQTFPEMLIPVCPVLHSSKHFRDECIPEPMIWKCDTLIAGYSIVNFRLIPG